MLDVPSLWRYLSRCLALAWTDERLVAEAWCCTFAEGGPPTPSVAGRVLPTRGGPAAEAVATVGTAMRCGLIPLTCCMLWWLLIGG